MFAHHDVNRGRLRADPWAFRVYLEAAASQLSALPRNHGRTESSRPDRNESPHTAPLARIRPVFLLVLSACTTPELLRTQRRRAQPTHGRNPRTTTTLSCSPTPSMSRDDNRENTIPVRSSMSHPADHHARDSSRHPDATVTTVREPEPLYFHSCTRWANQPFCTDKWRVDELRACPRAFSYRAALC
jgi:hypothetical protein